MTRWLAFAKRWLQRVVIKWCLDHTDMSKVELWWTIVSPISLIGGKVHVCGVLAVKCCAVLFLLFDDFVSHLLLACFWRSWVQVTDVVFKAISSSTSSGSHLSRKLWHKMDVNEIICEYYPHMHVLYYMYVCVCVESIIALLHHISSTYTVKCYDYVNNHGWMSLS